MPFAQVHITEGHSPEQKRVLIEKITQAVHDSIGGQVAKKYAHQLPDLIHELGTKKVGKNNPWLKAPYRWDVEMGPNYGTLSSAAKYLSSLPPPLPEPQLDGYTEGDKIEDLRNPDDWESPAPKPNKKKAA